MTGAGRGFGAAAGVGVAAGRALKAAGLSREYVGDLAFGARLQAVKAGQRADVVLKCQHEVLRGRSKHGVADDEEDHPIAKAPTVWRVTGRGFTPIAQDDRLQQACPSQVVDVIDQRAGTSLRP